MFRGAITALITPFKNGALDEAALQSLVDWQITEGIDGWCRSARRAKARR